MSAMLRILLALAAAIAAGLVINANSDAALLPVWLGVASILIVLAATVFAIRKMHALGKEAATLRASHVQMKQLCMAADARLSDMTLAIKGSVWETNTNGRFIFMSDSIQDFTGVPPQENYVKADGNFCSYRGIAYNVDREKR